MPVGDLARIYAEWAHALPHYEQGWRFFKGRQSEYFATARAKQLLERAGITDMKRFNYAAIAVNTIIDRLHVTAVVTGTGDRADLIAEVSTENQTAQEEQVRWQYLGAMGEVYGVVLPVEDGDENRPSGVSMAVWSPTRARVLYEADDPLAMRCGVLTWYNSATKKTRADLYYPTGSDNAPDGNLERWIGEGDLKDVSSWKAWSCDDPDNLLPEAETIDLGEDGLPFFHYRTGRPDAEPLHVAAYGPQQAIDKTIISHLATLDTATFPQRWGQVDPNADLQSVGTSNNPFHPGMEGDEDPETETGTGSLSADPGAMWRLQGYTGVGQFSAADPKAFLDPLNQWVKSMAQVTRIPMHYFDPTGDPPSGESLKVMDAPVDHRVDSLKVFCGATLAEEWEAALDFAGAAGTDVLIRWAPHQTATDLASWTTIAAKIAAGVPREVALVEAGYDPDTVKGWLAALDDDAEISRRVALLDTLGEAMTKMASASALGLDLSPVNALVTSVLTAVANLETKAGSDG